MFRDMRRSRQRLTDEESAAILRSGKSGVLGVIGDDGYPYTVPVNYVYDQGRIYFHCAKSGHKLDAIRRCPKVSLCVVEKEDIVVEELTTYFRSVILFGQARVLEGEEERFRAAEIFGLKYCNDKEKVDQEIRKEMAALCCVEIQVEHMTGKEAIELTKLRGRPKQE